MCPAHATCMTRHPALLSCPPRTCAVALCACTVEGSAGVAPSSNTSYLRCCRSVCRTKHTSARGQQQSGHRLHSTHTVRGVHAHPVSLHALATQNFTRTHMPTRGRTGTHPHAVARTHPRHASHQADVVAQLAVALGRQRGALGEARQGLLGVAQGHHGRLQCVCVWGGGTRGAGPKSAERCQSDRAHTAARAAGHAHARRHAAPSPRRRDHTPHARTHTHTPASPPWSA
jgi:hypothetical protein